MSSLSHLEQDALYAIHQSIFGSVIASRLRNNVRSYNTSTLDVTEVILNELRKCNASVQALLVGLAGGSALITKGWLRSVLEKLADEMSKDSFSLNGAGCRNQAASHWVRELQMTALGI